eukprot:30189-Eustigmatos_ZCMA.PRE.1
MAHSQPEGLRGRLHLHARRRRLQPGRPELRRGQRRPHGAGLVPARGGPAAAGHRPGHRGHRAAAERHTGDRQTAGVLVAGLDPGRGGA